MIKMSNSLDPNQARHSARPDLGPNCLQKLSEDNTSRSRVNSLFVVAPIVCWVHFVECFGVLSSLAIILLRKR